MSLIVSVLGCSLLLMGISGCTKFVKTPPETIVKVQTVEVKKPKLTVQKPDTVRMRNVTWHVITVENFEQKIAEITASGNAAVFFALTSNGYENLSLNMNDLRAFIEQQKSIIVAMENYYTK